MAVFVALLRAVNVGPNNRMKMAALRECFTRLGFDGAQTFLQTGNVVFQSVDGNREELAHRIEASVEQAFGFGSEIILRTDGELTRVIESNPFAPRQDIDPAKLLVVFLSRPLSPQESVSLQAIDSAPDEIAPAESEIYIYYPNGMGRSKLNPKLDNVLKNKGTGRNWNSVTGILKLMRSGVGNH